MPLFYHHSSHHLPELPVPEGLVIRATTDIFLLATIGSLSVEAVIHRLTTGNRAYVALFNDRPAAFGWLATQSAEIGELRNRIQLPAGHGYLWNFRTLPEFRGRGIYPVLLQWMLRHEPALHQFWIIHAPENIASQSGIRKAGFQFAGHLSLNGTQKTTLTAVGLSPSMMIQLQQMGISINSGTGASCWNCHSPYLTKKQTGCCCTDRNLACRPGTINNQNFNHQQHEKAYLHLTI